VSITRLKIWAWRASFDLLFLGLLEVLRLPIIIPKGIATCPAPAIRDPKTGCLLLCSLWSQWLWLLLWCLLIQSFGEGWAPRVCKCLFGLFLCLLSRTFPWCIGCITTAHPALTHHSWWLIQWLCRFDAWREASYKGLMITRNTHTLSCACAVVDTTLLLSILILIRGGLVRPRVALGQPGLRCRSTAQAGRGRRLIFIASGRRLRSRLAFGWLAIAIGTHFEIFDLYRFKFTLKE
jgi:hypothetical protein